MKHIDSIKSLIDQLGGSASISRELGFKHASTVSEMKRRGSIPVEYWDGFIKIAEGRGVEGIDYEKLVRLHTPAAA